jgi:hypothetical protein
VPLKSIDIEQHGTGFGDTDGSGSFASFVIDSLAVAVFTIVFCKITKA